MMCAIFLSHFVFAVFWRTLVAFGFVFHHDWFCRLYVLGILIAVVRKPGKVRACEEKRCVVANVKVVVVCGGAGSWHLTD